MSVEREEASAESFRQRMAKAGASPITLLAFDGVSGILLDILNEIRDLKNLTAERHNDS